MDTINNDLVLQLSITIESLQCLFCDHRVGENAGKSIENSLAIG